NANNQLDYVEDHVSPTAYTTDFNDSDPGNFQYNKIGQLISDDSAQIANIEWNVYGKVKSIVRTTGSTEPDLEFRYDPFGNRVLKIEKKKDGSGNLKPESDWIYTHYRTDASGNTMAVYDTKTENTDYLIHSIKERYLYGNKRIGTESESQRLMYSRLTTYNGLDDMVIDRIKHYNTSSEYLIRFTGSSLSTSANIKFHYTDNDGSSTKTSGCTQTGSLTSVMNAFMTQIENEKSQLDTVHVNDTSFIVTGSTSGFLQDGQVSYDHVGDLEISITSLDSIVNRQVSPHHYDETHYELSNHLGNVQSVVSNRYWFNTSDEQSADIVSYKDYFPYGFEMPGRVQNSTEYRYSFNGMENDPEVKGTGNSIDFGSRMYDSRLGRWFSPDPLASKYPHLSPYSFAGLRPSVYGDYDGEDFGIIFNHNTKTIIIVANIYTNKESLERAKAAAKHWNSEKRYQYSFYNKDKNKRENYDVEFQICVQQPGDFNDYASKAYDDPIGNSFVLIDDTNPEKREYFFDDDHELGKTIGFKYARSRKTRGLQTDAHEVGHFLMSEWRHSDPHTNTKGDLLNDDIKEGGLDIGKAIIQNILKASGIGGISMPNVTNDKGSKPNIVRTDEGKRPTNFGNGEIRVKRSTTIGPRNKGDKSKTIRHDD
ncbi:MAG: RHS repeat-associated core domain-containing protein, partial [Salibacter sp.]|uniref:RHS repeat-associated core domain-containing protein n=1 Tax=Salibacter sp. TaxID=2010995 RepID=UPI00286FDDB3